ncbi:hypothetical protein [Paenibacillus favisporus]|uniref:hypothetical protein n=1 Tax=Paenibacillus favisporus TaxID=221028 RepID=UPI00197D0D07|nr:hypothetical protein [Paenibacillus favisporus]
MEQPRYAEIEYFVCIDSPVTGGFLLAWAQLNANGQENKRSCLLTAPFIVQKKRDIEPKNRFFLFFFQLFVTECVFYYRKSNLIRKELIKKIICSLLCGNEMVDSNQN